MGPIKLLETVAVVADAPEMGLAAGEVGAAVEELGGDAFEVEFCDPDGSTYPCTPSERSNLSLSTPGGKRFDSAPAQHNLPAAYRATFEARQELVVKCVSSRQM